MKTKSKEYTAFDSFGFALYAFGGLGMELLLLMAETAVWRNTQQAWTVSQNMIHWGLTCIIWSVIGYYLMRKLPVTADKINHISWLSVGMVMVISITYTSIVWDGWKPWIEFTRNGALKFVVQYLYYAFEGLLITLIIAHGQRAFDLWRSKNAVHPFGGIMLASTWGLIHIFTQGMDTGIYAVVQSLLFGVVYLALKKNFKLSCLVITIMFMI